VFAKVDLDIAYVAMAMGVFVALGKKYIEPRTELKIPRIELKILKPDFSVPYSVPNSQEPKLPR
jgi:hypothetical protein